MMEGNPYIELIKTMRQEAKNQAPVGFVYGKVITADPLKIDVSNTVQEGADLLKLECKVSDTVPISVNGITEENEITLTGSTTDGLTSGDYILLLPIDDQQRFIILGKVVSV